MRILDIDSGGGIEYLDRLYLGWSFNMYRRLAQGGIGSPKMAYVSGISHFDRLVREKENAKPRINIELFRQGIMVRLNAGQRLAAVAIRIEHIDRISLVAHRTKAIVRTNQSTMSRGELEIEVQETILRCTIYSQDYESVRKFFRKEAFNRIFTESD